MRSTVPTIHRLFVAGLGLLPVVAVAQPLSVEFRNVAPLGNQTSDQNGRPFTVTGMSGLTWVGGNDFFAIMDNSNKLVRITIGLSPNGAIPGADYGGGISLPDTYDFEGVAIGGPRHIYAAEETTPGVYKYSLDSFERVESLFVPHYFGSRRENFGFESMTFGTSTFSLWTANEEALSQDGPLSTPQQGSVVRLLHYGRDGGITPDVQYAYVTDPIHGPAIMGARSGLVDLVALPDGRLLSLERSFAGTVPPFQNRIYEVNRAGATNVSGLPALEGAAYTPVGKRLLWSGALGNLEGLALGPQLTGGNWALVGVIDDGDPISMNAVVGFELSGDIGLECDACDTNCDGVLDAFDIEPFVNVLLNPSAPRCDSCTGDANYDGVIDAFDIEPFVNCIIP